MFLCPSSRRTTRRWACWAWSPVLKTTGSTWRAAPRTRIYRTPPSRTSGGSTCTVSRKGSNELQIRIDKNKFTVEEKIRDVCNNVKNTWHWQNPQVAPPEKKFVVLNCRIQIATSSRGGSDVFKMTTVLRTVVPALAVLHIRWCDMCHCIQTTKLKAKY